MIMIDNVSIKLWRRIHSLARRLFRHINPQRLTQPKVLVLGIYLADRPNLIRHIVQELGESMRYRVTQRWAALNGEAPAPHVEKVTHLKLWQRVPKFALLNRLREGVNVLDYDFILLCDDDIQLPEQFVDRLLDRQSRYDFALAQPARTHNSYTDHKIVEQVDGLDARRTRFVEIGPVVSLRRDAVALLLPFDEACGMGWGLDLLWPVTMEQAGLKMGIIDATPVAHALRPAAKSYGLDEALAHMLAYLKDKPHLTKEQAMVVLERHAI
jgi:hypothetical protein